MRDEAGQRVHHATQNSTQFKNSKLFISGIFHLMFLGHGSVWIVETTESKAGKGDDCNALCRRDLVC